MHSSHAESHAFEVYVILNDVRASCLLAQQQPYM